MEQTEILNNSKNEYPESAPTVNIVVAVARTQGLLQSSLEARKQHWQPWGPSGVFNARAGGGLT